MGADSDWFARALRSGAGWREVPATVLVKGVGTDNASHDVATYRTELLEVVRRHGRRPAPPTVQPPLVAGTGTIQRTDDRPEGRDGS